MKFSRRLSMAMDALKKITGYSSTGHMKNKDEIIQLVNEILEWNEGDIDSLKHYGECPLDEDCVKVRKKTIKKLKKLLVSK